MSSSVRSHVFCVACFCSVRHVCGRLQARISRRVFFLSFDCQSERREGLGKRFDHLLHSLQHRIHRYLSTPAPQSSYLEKKLLATHLSPWLLSVGPKLYKEPSAKSNKHIIQNALAHCCLAGKVNEGQKNKILDVWELSARLSFSEIKLHSEINNSFFSVL